MLDELACEGTPNRTELGSKRLPIGSSPKVFTGPGDVALLLAEWAIRQVYWRSNWARALLSRRRTRTRSIAQVAGREEFEDHLRQIGVCPGALVMAHTSVSGVQFRGETSEVDSAPNPMQVANNLLTMLLDAVGSLGTLCMPTNPVYKAVRHDSNSSQSGSVPMYDPRSTPCGVGLANELFWRRSGTKRSLHPHNTLAARGPLASELLRNNLNASKPLPHGIDSGYYRFAIRNGLLLSVGVPLTSVVTLGHIAEESLGEQWPVPDFFEEQNYILRNDGEDRSVTVRKTRTEFMKFSLCNRKFRRDIRKTGIVHEGQVGTIRVDWARAGEVYEFLRDRNRSSTYPFFFTSLVPRKSQGHA